MNVKEIYIIMTVKLLLLAEASLITLKNPNINNLLVISLLGNQAIHVEDFQRTLIFNENNYSMSNCFPLVIFFPQN